LLRFLLVSLNIDAILRESTIYQRRERLKNIAERLGLEGTYGATIERMMAQGGSKSRLGVAALMWISHAEKPLGADDLCHALAVELGSTEINPGNVPSISTLMSCCQGLITMDGEAPTVRLIHSTLKEYFSARPDIFSRPHSTMAEVCLTYLNSKQVKAPSAYTSLGIPKIPFLEYSSVYWGVHAKRDLSDHASSLALELFRDYDGHISTKPLLEKAGYHDFSSASLSFSGLHCVSFFGIAELVDVLIRMECYGIDPRDSWGHTPLSWAARNGHWVVVKMLVGHEVINPENSDKYGRTPLWHAADRGHENVVIILLGQEMISPDKPDNNGQTPLASAARNGREGVVQILLGCGKVNPNKIDKYGRTPLSHAASNAQVKVVKTLLQRGGASPDKADKGNRTPLSYAAQYGHDGVVKVLLWWQEVNPAEPDICGRTPLWYAASSGREKVVKLLLGWEGVDPNKPDNAGQTPLTLAAWNGHELVVGILLGQAEIDPDMPDKYGRTPLSYATRHGHDGAVKMLLRREEVNPNKPDNHGQTPLASAARWGHQTVGALLKARQAATYSAI